MGISDGSGEDRPSSPAGRVAEARGNVGGPADAGGGAPGTAKAVWNSLEVVKLIVGAMTPLTVFLVGAHLSNQQAREAVERQTVASRAASRERTLNLRLETWRRAYPKLQDYYNYIGAHLAPDPADTGERRAAHMALHDGARDALGAETVLFSHGFQLALVRYFTYLTKLDTDRVADPGRIGDARRELIRRHADFLKIVSAELNPDEGTGGSALAC